MRMVCFLLVRGVEVEVEVVDLCLPGVRLGDLLWVGECSGVVAEEVDEDWWWREEISRGGGFLLRRSMLAEESGELGSSG